VSGQRRRLIIAGYVAALGLAVAVPGVAGVMTHFFSSDGPEPITAIPANDPSRGLTYTGLQPAPKGDPCVGAYTVNERGQCSHGPDPVPPGIDFTAQPVPLAAQGTEPAQPPADTVAGPRDADLARDAGGAFASNGFVLAPDNPGADGLNFTLVNGIACEGDGVTGKRVQVLYARDAGVASRFAQFAETFRTIAAGVDTIYSASAKETGGERHVRFVHTPDCRVDVQEVELPAGSMADFGRTISALKALGFNRTDRKYMIFGESRVYCGIGTFAGDDRPGAANRSNGGPGYGRSDSSCWSAGVAAHELGHNLGAVNNSAPNSSKAGHCVDEFDVMCYKDTAQTQLRTACANRAQDQRLDCNHDDYYHTNPAAGSYLATRWNMADSDFLIKGAGGANPNPSPSPSRTQSSSRPANPPPPSPSQTSVKPPSSPSPSASRTSSPPPQPPPAELKTLTVSDTTSTSTRLSWPASTVEGTQYQVLLFGKVIGTQAATGVRITGMLPNTQYVFEIALAPNGSKWTKPATVNTPAAADPVGASFMVWTNALTGQVADVYGARRGDGAPLISYQRHGNANQQFKAEPVAGTDKVLVRAKHSDKCVAPLGNRNVAGMPLVQVTCDPAAAAQQWTLVTTEFGMALQNASGLVMGVGQARFGNQRLLVLQRANGSRAQSWTTVAP